jgi:hypothetical protein
MVSGLWLLSGLQFVSRFALDGDGIFKDGILKGVSLEQFQSWW